MSINDSSNNIDNFTLDRFEKDSVITKQTNKSDNYLKPRDFLNLIQNEKELSNEYCYLNKRSNPYDWEIVDFNHRNKNQYMTISTKGIQ